VTYTSNSAGTTVTYPVTNAAFHFSPINWVGDTGRGGSVYRRSAYPGAYFSFTFTASSSPTATILLGGTGSSTASVFVNGTLTDNVSVSGATLAISGLTPSASNTVTVWLRTNGTWGNAGTQVEVTGMQLDSSSTPGTAPTYPKGWIEIVGDSITHGYKTDWVAQTNFVHTYAFMICQSLMQDGYDCGINAITGSGWLVPGNSGNFPAYYVVSGSSGGVGGTYTDASSRWNKVDSGLSALDSNSHLSAYGSTGQEPVGVFICYGTNEANQNTTYDTSDTQAAVNQSITAIRAAAPKAKIGVILPFPLLAGVDYSAAISASYLAAIEAGIAAHSGDPAVGTINVGAPLATYVYSNQSSSFSATSPATAGDTFHPTALGHAMFAPAILDQIKAMYAGAGTSYRYGFH
jgi:lysophospholipase L1-like esterase